MMEEISPTDGTAFKYMLVLHDDVNKWKLFSTLVAFVRAFHLTKASGPELWCFIWSAPEQTVE